MTLAVLATLTWLMAPVLGFFVPGPVGAGATWCWIGPVGVVVTTTWTRPPLDGFVSEAIGLDAIEDASEEMHRGEVLRSMVTL